MPHLNYEEFQTLLSRMDKHSWTLVNVFLQGRGIKSFKEIFLHNNPEDWMTAEDGNTYHKASYIAGSQAAKKEHLSPHSSKSPSPKNNKELLKICYDNIDIFALREKGFVIENFKYLQKNPTYNFTAPQKKMLVFIQGMLYARGIIDEDPTPAT